MLTIFLGIQRIQKEKKELAQNSEEWAGLAVKICKVFCPEERLLKVYVYCIITGQLFLPPV